MTLTKNESAPVNCYDVAMAAFNALGLSSLVVSRNDLSGCKTILNGKTALGVPLSVAVGWHGCIAWSGRPCSLVIYASEVLPDEYCLNIDNDCLVFENSAPSLQCYMDSLDELASIIDKRMAARADDAPVARAADYAARYAGLTVLHGNKQAANVDPALNSAPLATLAQQLAFAVVPGYAFLKVNTEDFGSAHVCNGRVSIRCMLSYSGKYEVHAVYCSAGVFYASFNSLDEMVAAFDVLVRGLALVVDPIRESLAAAA